MLLPTPCVSRCQLSPLPPLCCPLPPRPIVRRLPGKEHGVGVTSVSYTFCLSPYFPSPHHPLLCRLSKLFHPPTPWPMCRLTPGQSGTQRCRCHHLVNVLSATLTSSATLLTAKVSFVAVFLADALTAVLSATCPAQIQYCHHRCLVDPCLLLCHLLSGCPPPSCLVGLCA